MKRFDVIVVGLGAVGAATAYQLAKRGAVVLGIDKFSPPHTYGSTHGDTRITRQAIGEGGAYVPMALRAHDLWREIETASGQELLTVTGGLILGKRGVSGSTHGKGDFVQRTIAAAAEFHIDHDVLTAQDMQSRFPQLQSLSDEVGYFETGSGFLRPERCVAAQLSLAQQHGATLHLNETVVSCNPARGGVAVTTQTEYYEANHAVIAVGPWVQRFFAGSPDLFTVNRQVMTWFDVSSAYERYAPAVFPIFVWDRGDDGLMYGFPAIDGPQGGLKVATEQFHDATDPEQVQREAGEDEVAAMYEGNVHGRLVGVGPRCVRAVTCLYTCTPDFDFVIDHHPASEAMFVVSACSGHGFKHSAAIGEAMAQWVLEGGSALDLSAFSLGRFARTSSNSQPR